MLRMVAAITSLSQHFDALRDRPELYRPAACPHCGFGRLWCHGSYPRKPDRRAPPQATDNPVPIPRFCCAYCKRTCSRLPGFLPPRRWYEWVVQQCVLLSLLLGDSVRRCSAQGPSRSTVRRWRGWLHAQHEAFAFRLRSRFPELGRTLDRSSFWQTCIALMSLAGAMAWLDREIVVP